MYLKQDFGFKPRILLVEDDPVTRDLVAADLQAEGLEIYLSGSVASCGSMLDQNFDIILLDLNLPDGTGRDVMEMIRTRPHLHSAVICLSASEQSEDILAMFQLGALDYVIKPFNRVVLRTKVATLLKIRQQTIALDQKNAQLQTSVEAAERAKRIESNFLSNMSHEIRNPLNGIRGVLEGFAEADNLTEEQTDDLNGAISAAEMLRSIVDDILDIKKLEDGKLELSPQTIDVQAFAPSNALTFRLLAAQKGLTFSVEGVDSLPRFLIFDPVRVMQIVTNLVSNAIKFTAGGSVTVRVSYADDALMLTVTDTGLGMSPETTSILFARFSQAEDGSTKGIQGTGLGLAISKDLAELMGGSIAVQSELGVGSTFTVRIPMAIDQVKEALWLEGKIPPVSVDDALDIDLSGIRILCVDDSNLNLKVLARPLRRVGATVVTAESGKEALNLIRENAFDIVLTDISMPEMDGEELQREIHQWKLKIPVVAITGNILEDDTVRYLKNGFVAALGKPLDIDALFAVVDQFARRS